MPLVILEITIIYDAITMCREKCLFKKLMNKKVRRTIALRNELLGHSEKETAWNLIESNDLVVTIYYTRNFI